MTLRWIFYIISNNDLPSWWIIFKQILFAFYFFFSHSINFIKNEFFEHLKNLINVEILYELGILILFIHFKDNLIILVKK